MKLRIKGDSVRLRLTEPEVRTLADGGWVEEVTHFPGTAMLRYRVEVGSGMGGVQAGLVKSCLWVRLPKDVVQRWAGSGQVGIEGSHVLEGGATLRILVEKDFACLNPAHGPMDAGAYPNPKTSCETSEQ